MLPWKRFLVLGSIANYRSRLGSYPAAGCVSVLDVLSIYRNLEGVYLPPVVVFLSFPMGVVG